jgi:hypothetical protein
LSAGNKGRFTFRTAAVFFWLSALLEIFSVTSRVAIGGALRDGSIAVIWHLVYFGLFLGLGIGLWRAKPWGYRLVFIGTLFYTLDKVSSLFYPDFLKAWLIQLFNRYGDIWQLIDIGIALKFFILLMLLLVGCWWGFAVYTYLRRAYFGLGQPPEVPAPQNQTSL